MGSNSHSSLFFTESSSTFTVPKGVKKIDVFCVGGGGGASSCFYQDYPDYHSGSSGGGGGYTSTVLDVDVSEGQQLSVAVGAGGSWLINNGAEIVNGGLSSVGSICSANGGNCADSFTGGNGGDGGSGGGVAELYSYSFGGVMHKETAGGSDGGDGIGIAGWRLGGKGQHTTTRYFGESTGTLYSTGGDGTACKETYPNQTANTGNGGSGAFGFLNNTARNCNKGASGICIIRWSGK